MLRVAGLPETNPRRPRPEYATAARAAGVLGGLLILVACVLTAWPVAALAADLGCGPLPSARIGALWVLLPGPVLMLPQFDQALALPVALSAAALARAVRAGRGSGTGWAAASGVAGGVALGLSYGAPAFLALGGLAVLAAAWARGVPPRAALARAAGHHPIASAIEALRIHREFFTLPRAYALWLLFDPLDLAVFLGLPVALSLVWATARAARRLAARARPTAEEAFRLAAMAALAALLLSGQTRGEVGRIWIPVMPVLLVAALARPAEERPGAADALLLAVLLVPIDLVLALVWRFF